MSHVHLVWDWNGTLLDDLDVVVAATNAALAVAGGGPVTADQHRRDFRRPIAGYYAHVLGRPVEPDEFAVLDRVFHDTYRADLAACALAVGAAEAMDGWPGTQSLLSLWFHHELVAQLDIRGLTDRFARVDGRLGQIGGGLKTGPLTDHLAMLGVAGRDTVLVGDSLDDADAAAAVGACCVLYSGGFTDPERLQATGLPVASTLLEAAKLATTPGRRR